MTGSRKNLALLSLIVVISVICSVWFATAELNGKNWDEGHSLRNVRSILVTGSWRPTFPFYPALSHLPQAALMSASRSLYRATGNQAFRIFKPSGNFTATAYLIGRLTSVAYSVGVLLMVYWIGRRIFSEGVGVLATAILAVSPFFLNLAGTYKPDPLLMLTALAAFWFAARAAEEGHAKHYLLAGVAVGLSAASKQNGAFSSIPLVVATALGYREIKRWLWLAAAGALSVAVFLIFNPWPELLPKYLAMGERYVYWTHTGAAPTAPVAHILVYAAGLPFHRGWHGFAIGSAAWLGLIGLAVQAFRKRRQWPEQAGATLLVFFVVVYPLACAAVSTYPKSNIFVPTLPFTALAAAWALASASQLLIDTARGRSGLVALCLGAVLLLAITTVPYATYLYGVAVPETTQKAARWIERSAGHLDQRTIVSEGAALGIGQRPSSRQVDFPLELTPERLADLPVSALDLADYEVFPQSALEGENRDFYTARMARLGGGRGVRVFAPRAFRLRNRSLVVLAHPWRMVPTRNRDAAAVPVEWFRQGNRKLSGNFARRFKAGQIVSLDLALTPQQAIECELELDTTKVPVHMYQTDVGRAHYMTPKFALKRSATPIRIRCPRRQLFEPTPSVGVIRWYRGKPPATAN